MISKAKRIFNEDEDIFFSHQAYTDGLQTRGLPALRGNKRKRKMTHMPYPVFLFSVKIETPRSVAGKLSCAAACSIQFQAFAAFVTLQRNTVHTSNMCKYQSSTIQKALSEELY